MLEWFDAVGYSADIPSLESRWGIRPHDVEAVGATGLIA